MQVLDLVQLGTTSIPNHHDVTPALSCSQAHENITTNGIMHSTDEMLDESYAYLYLRHALFLVFITTRGKFERNLTKTLLEFERIATLLHR